MKQFRFILFFSFIFPGLVKSQETVENSLGSSEGKELRNQIGLNVSPIILVMLGGPSDYHSYTLTYKRINNNGALRARLAFIDDKLRNTRSRHLVIPGKLIAETDSTETRMADSRTINNWRIGIGYEWHKSWFENVTIYYGLEVFTGFRTRSQFKNIAVYAKDTVHGTSYLTEKIEDIYKKSERASTYRIGGVPFIGLDITPLPNFSLTLQAEYGFTYSRGAQVIDKGTALEKTETAFFSGETLNRGFISEVSLLFHF